MSNVNNIVESVPFGTDIKKEAAHPQCGGSRYPAANLLVADFLREVWGRRNLALPPRRRLSRLPAWMHHTRHFCRVLLKLHGTPRRHPPCLSHPPTQPMFSSFAEELGWLRRMAARAAIDDSAAGRTPPQEFIRNILPEWGGYSYTVEFAGVSCPWNPGIGSALWRSLCRVVLGRTAEYPAEDFQPLWPEGRGNPRSLLWLRAFPQMWGFVSDAISPWDIASVMDILPDEFLEEELVLGVHARTPGVDMEALLAAVRGHYGYRHYYVDGARIRINPWELQGHVHHLSPWKKVLRQIREASPAIFAGLEAAEIVIDTTESYSRLFRYPEDMTDAAA